MKISCDFEFPSVKEFAIQNLETSGLGYPERIKVYQNHNVDPRIHILPLIVEMTMRAEPPSDGEAEIMGWATAATIFRARERLLNPNGSSTIATKVDAAKAILTVASDNSSLKVKADATGAGNRVASLRVVSWRIDFVGFQQVLRQKIREIPNERLLVLDLDLVLEPGATAPLHQGQIPPIEISEMPIRTSPEPLMLGDLPLEHDQSADRRIEMSGNLTTTKSCLCYVTN